MSSKGESIRNSFEFMKKFFTEVSQLLIKIDELMDREGWTTSGNRVTSDFSADLNKPEKWSAQGCFRVYENEKYPKTKKVVTIDWADKNNSEPILVVGTLLYLEIESALLWDLWTLYFDSGHTRQIRKQYLEKTPKARWIKEGTIESANFYAMNLVDIKNEDDIKKEIFDRLMDED